MGSPLKKIEYTVITKYGNYIVMARNHGSALDKARKVIGLDLKMNEVTIFPPLPLDPVTYAKS